MEKQRHIDELNTRFGIHGLVEVVAGNGGLPKLRITSPAASAEIYLHGAQVTSWRPAGADEVLFLSQCSSWADGHPIRGGIPVCFPWLGVKSEDPKAPTHGFVRTKEWRLDSVIAETEDTVIIVLSTESDPSTRLWWPHGFRLVHRITVGKTLRLELNVTNTGTDVFQFEEALHTYFQVGDVSEVRITGLDGVAYLDNTDANRKKMQAGDIVFSASTDNVYIEARGAAQILDPVLGRKILTEKENSATTIVWNPWDTGALRISDLGDDEWEQMVCVEASNIRAAAVSLEPGHQHNMQATLSHVAYTESAE